LSLYNAQNLDNKQKESLAAQKRTLEQILQSKEAPASTIEKMIDTIALKGIQTRLQTVLSISKELAEKYSVVIQALDKDSTAFEKIVNTELTYEKIDTLNTPEQFKQFLKQGLKNSIISKYKHLISKNLKKSLNTNTYEKRTLEQISEKIPTIIIQTHNPFLKEDKTISFEKTKTKFMSKATARINFFKIQLPFLLHECKQGFGKQQVIDGGVCQALCLRWASLDLKGALKTSSRLDVQPEDRMGQSQYDVQRSMELKKKQEETTEEKYIRYHYPKELLHRHGFSSAEVVTILRGQMVSDSETVTRSVLNRMTHAEEGIFHITWFLKAGGAHSIYLSYNQESDPPTYNMGDPNVGIFQFETPQQLNDGFNDLLKSFYPEKKNTICLVALK